MRRRQNPVRRAGITSASAVQIAVALAEAFDTDVNGLPLSFILSWYEQKAVCILLSLLHLGIKNIKLGPSLPAFITPPAPGSFNSADKRGGDFATMRPQPYRKAWDTSLYLVVLSGLLAKGGSVPSPEKNRPNGARKYSLKSGICYKMPP